MICDAEILFAFWNREMQEISCEALHLELVKLNLTQTDCFVTKKYTLELFLPCGCERVTLGGYSKSLEEVEFMMQIYRVEINVKVT